MKARNEIPYTAEELLEIFDYDRENGKLYWKKKVSRKVVVGKEAGYVTCGYRSVKYNNVKYRIHRLIFYIETGTQPDYIDHINGNTIDNRFVNLQEVSQSENMMKATNNKRNKSGCRGVSWQESRGKWQVHIQADKKNMYIGIFDTIEEAIAARRKAEDKYFGEHVPIDRDKQARVRS